MVFWRRSQSRSIDSITQFVYMYSSLEVSTNFTNDYKISKMIDMKRSLIIIILLLISISLIPIISAEDYFGVTPDLSELSDRQRQCLCSVACYKENWNCSVVSCYYDPTNACNEYYQGECYCGGFGCGRAKIGNLTGGEMLDCMMSSTEPDTQIENYDNQIKQLLNGILIYISKGNEQEAQAATRDLLNVIGLKINYNLDNRGDLDDATKAVIKDTISDLIYSVRFQSPGKGSKIDSCGFLWTSDCLYLDPITSQDIIVHEFSHLIAEKLTPGYIMPGGDSTHDFFGYSSSLERSYDEALATVIAIDLLGESKYSSVDSGVSTNYNSVKQGSLADNEYEYNFVNQEMIEYPNSDSKDPIIYDDKRINWFGYTGKAKQTALSKLEDVEIDLELARKNEDINEVNRLTVLKHKYLKYLNPPVNSPKSEVAVASLIWDLTGSKVDSNRLGRIKKAIDDYYNKYNQAPRTEQEFLIGFLLGKDEGSEEVSGALDIVTGERHNRKYTINDILK